MATDQLHSVDTYIFGRITYQLMASYWPSPAAMADDPVVADRMNTQSKIVFSRTLNLDEKLNLKLIKTKVFGSGNVLLYYQTADKK